MKHALIISACIGLASLASAQKGSGGATDVLEAANTSAGMPAGNLVAVSSTYDPAVGTTTEVYDIGGIESWDGLGDPDNTVFAASVGDSVVAIGWDFSLASVGASWLSESSISFQGDVFLTPGSGDDFPGTSSYSSGAPIVLADLGIPDIIVAGGILPIEFFEAFDDNPDAVDAIYLPGSELTLVYTGGAAGVPTVSQWGLVLLTILLLGGVVVMMVRGRRTTRAGWRE